MDSASDSADLEQATAEVRPRDVVASSLRDVEAVDDLYRLSGAEAFGLTLADFAVALDEAGRKSNFGLAAGAPAEAHQRQAFYRALHLRELALARACALGREAAWTQFMAEFRGPVLQAAIGITRSSSLGEELADSLYSELFGLTQRDGRRWSPLETYSGRGSLMGWLRAMLAQRHVNHFRKTHRESPLEDVEPVANAVAEPQPVQATELAEAVSGVLGGLDAEARFLLSAYYLDRRTLLELGGVLRVHEATVSRKLKRVTEEVRKKLLKALQNRGMSRRAAEEALGVDPGDLDLNLRKLLQAPGDPAFLRKEGGL
ncbi:sigma-70 family RNA polymerase sigma factor [Occallatibacter riparius]|uniref:Sigma-70 family RNA polymerase sigma factor n=1 Tax=Occallatibacter riparius TaxID=1002689 RepID=A0A9J7BMW2_9BACT|nr:sigma-70 family RNA polymerase sigma factor [Occallatibacter riparius]UWZ83841.1 sigma-70 family RNA polymerase sigma factor [Occallatibacter riparius]